MFSSRSRIIAAALVTTCAGTAAVSLVRAAEGAIQAAPLNIARAPIKTAGFKHPSSDPQNLEGRWQPLFQPPTVESAIGTSGAATTIEGGPLPLTEAGKKIYEHRIQMEQRGTPVVNTAGTCRPGLPHSVFPLYLAPFQILQSADRTTIIAESGDTVWTVYHRGTHPKKLPLTYQGHSIGRWEGPTLVIDSIGFNTRTWLDPIGAPHSDKLRIITRITKIDLGAGTGLRVMMTADDPEMYTRPWTQAFTVEYRPDLSLYEVHCLENVRPENNENMVYEDLEPVPGVNHP